MTERILETESPCALTPRPDTWCIQRRARSLVVSPWKRVNKNRGSEVTGMGKEGSCKNFGFCTEVEP